MSESSSQSQRKSFLGQLPLPSLRTANPGVDEPSDVAIVGVSEGASLSPTAALIDQQIGGAIARLLKAGKLSADEGETMLLAGPAEGGPKLVLVIGLGQLISDSQANRELAFRLTSQAIRGLVGKSHETFFVALAESFDASTHDMVVAGALYALEGQSIYRTKAVINVPQTIVFSAVDQDAVKRGETLGQSVNLARRLINEPASAIYPESFADIISELSVENGIDCQVWDETKLAEENCRSILAVGGGSERPPRLVIMRYNGGKQGDAPIALVGKGVTFDSGGLSLKPSDGMVDMKCDMGGAATVVATMNAIAKLGVKRNVVAVCGLAENMVSGSSYKLGDVIKTRSGKTIEILNTDAEGRVVLADALNVAISFEPSAMVDLATLTGACMVALGNEVAGLMANDQTVADQITAAAEAEGELVWPLPMHSLYDEKVKSKVADIKNVGEGRWGGAITAAKFLENFVESTPWVHLDIAGPAFSDSPKPHRDAGATGVYVKTLVRWIESL
ncbi:leucyl aminopeptidase [Roseiconus lacunae]|uniref:Probable cytosol aminopeptidase n=1 Tax=Roseiconus lacunae TaxID=2605694 RepID=A0ABT7PBK4_9BACT|nr:leucyl aminopeptidase [Roseiconus lacunae]MCD0463080.1 leucyl aminopeptidase [Roseiconus lacunae]MDM4013870.1 leucyl aminopeptidase [Roseiconus lacunae]